MKKPGEKIDKRVDKKQAKNKQQVSQTGRAKAGNVGRKAMRMTLLHVFEFAALLMVVIGVVFGLIAWQLSKGPIKLEFLQSDAEAALVQVFGGEVAKITSIEADWSRQEKSLVIVATDVEVFAVGGETIITIPRFEAGLDGLALLRGSIAFSRLVVIGGEVSFVRREDGAIAVGVGSVEQVLQNPNVWKQQQGIQAPVLRQAISNLQVLSIREGALNVQDFLSRIHWRAPDATISFRRKDERIEFFVDGIVQSNNRNSPLTLQGSSNRDFSNLSAIAEFKDYIPAELVPGMGQLSFLNRVQVLVSSSISIVTDDQGLLHDAKMQVDIGAGKIDIPDGEVNIDTGTLKASFDAGSGMLLVETAIVQGPKLNISFNGDVKGLDPARLIIGEQIDFNLNFDRTWFDLTGIMQGKVELDKAGLQGTILPEQYELLLSKWNIIANELKLSGDGSLKWLPSSEKDAGFAKIHLNGRSSGNAKLDEVLAFWPSKAAEGVRSWVKSNMRSAVISDLILQLKIDQSLQGSNGLSNDMLALSFSFDQLETTYFGTMPPIKQGKGTALLQGNRFDVNMTSARLMSNDLTAGYVEIPYLYPAGAIAVYGARATGELADLLYMLDQQPFGYASMYNITPSNVVGTGYVDFQMHRAMRTRVAFKDMKFSAKGSYNNVGAPELVFGQDLASVTMSFSADQSGMIIDGEGLIGDWPSKFFWSEDFKAVDEPRTNMSIETRLDVSFFDDLGLPTRDYFAGEIDLKIAMIGNGLMVQKAVVEADLSDSFIDLPGPGWNKPVGNPAVLSFQIVEALPGDYVVEQLLLQADGLDIAGGLAFSGESGLQSLKLETARLAGAFDFIADIDRDEAGIFQVKADVREADISFFTANLLKGGGSALALPIQAQINFQRVIAGERLLFDTGYFNFAYNGEQITTVDFFATSDPGEHKFSIKTDTDGVRRITAVSADGGAVLQSLLGLRGLDGGDLQLDGELANTADAATNIVLKMRDFQVNDTPVAAQILSLGSLKGLADTLSGSGIAFSELELPIKSRDGLIYIRGAHASGPAMGISLNGDVNLLSAELELKGAIAPAYTLNSIFRAIPIVGNVLVPGEGEGVFAINFNVQGPFSDPTVSVNPLSAFAPGVLRQMFGGSLPQVPEQVVPEIKTDENPDTKLDKVLTPKEVTVLEQATTPEVKEGVE